jgi:fibrillarin-like rRNA methylase
LEVEERKIAEALASGYNIATFRDKASAYTVDVIFSGDKLNKQAGTVAGVATFFQKPEGLVLAKLRMIKVTVPRERAVKDAEDVKTILAFTKVDLAAVERQSKKEDTWEIFQSLKDS